MPHIKTQTEWELEISAQILDFVHSELYLDLRFMDIALSALTPKADSSLQTFAVDGVYLHYSPAQLMRVFQNNPKFLGRAYLHSVLHCIFSHLWLAGSRDMRIWGIACDVAVEYTIDSMDKPCTRRILTWMRQQLYQQLQKENQGISAAVIYRILSSMPKEQLCALQMEFYTDDHCYWPRRGQPQNQIQTEAKNKWDKIARQTALQQKQHGDAQKDGGQCLAAQLKAAKSRRSYSDFLRKFTILREEMHCDPDEFDLNFYTYGLRLYGNMPLIEPVETREIRKIREFVIVLDTSDSTSGELVKNFLQETFRILSQKEYFFKACKIRILQCDDRVHMDQEICSHGQLAQLMEQFTIIGGGGTDFRPAFAYVNHLLEQGAFEKLGGLLYFTDGCGIYPKACPPYQAAFLFLNDYDDAAVPPWAMRLRLEPEEFMDSVRQ